MSFAETCRQADMPRTATTMRILRWKQSSGKHIYFLFTYGLPVVTGVGRWLASGSVQEVLIWVGGGFLIGCYLIVPILTTNYLVGPSDDEFQEILELFERNADNESQLHMAIKERRFDLYCEVTPDKSGYIGVRLPRKYWNDLLDDEIKLGLQSAGTKEFLEAEKNVYAFWPREDQNARPVLDYLLKITNSSLKEFAVSPVTTGSSGRIVFTDEPDKALFPNSGMKKK